MSEVTQKDFISTIYDKLEMNLDATTDILVFSDWLEENNKSDAAKFLRTVISNPGYKNEIMLRLFFQIEWLRVSDSKKFDYVLDSLVNHGFGNTIDEPVKLSAMMAGTLLRDNLNNPQIHGII